MGIDDDNKIPVNKFLYDMVRDNNLFLSGHFRINSVKSVRDWINLEKLFAFKKDEFIKPISSAIYDNILSGFNKEETVLIGFNYYGAILAAMIGYEYGFPFSYSFNEQSMVDNIENELQKMDAKYIVIIADIIVFGNSIGRFVNYLYEKILTSKDVNTDIITLFERKVENVYIANTYLNHNIRSVHVLNDDFDVELCRKDRNKCLFLNDKNLCQDNIFCGQKE